MNVDLAMTFRLDDSKKKKEKKLKLISAGIKCMGLTIDGACAND